MWSSSALHEERSEAEVEDHRLSIVIEEEGVAETFRQGACCTVE